MSEDEILTEMRNKVQPLTEEQMFYFRLLKNFSDKTICNANPVLIKLNDNVDLEKYSRVLFKLKEAHPALLSVVEEEKAYLFKDMCLNLIKLYLSKKFHMTSL